MNKIKVRIWDRDFDLDCLYQNYPNEEITKKQESTLAAIPSIDYSDSLIGIKQFVMKYNGSDIEGNTIENIFKYVMPKRILIIRDEHARSFAIICNYKFDMEHGIAVVYENEKFKAVGLQDLVL